MDLRTYYTIYVNFKNEFSKRKASNPLWKSLFDELDSKMYDIDEIEKKNNYFQNLPGESLSNNVEFEKFRKNMKYLEKQWKSIMKDGDYLYDYCKNKNVKLDNSDITRWNVIVTNCSLLTDYDKDKYKISYRGHCKICGRKWLSDKICKTKCIFCEDWEIIFELYHIMYENDFEFLDKLNIIKQMTYSSESPRPEAPKFRKKLEAQGVLIDDNIEKAWNIAANEIKEQGLFTIHTWDYYSTTEKCINGAKKLLGKFFS